MSGAALIGKTVKSAANESIGKISDYYLDASGAVKLVVVSVGGFLGVGSKEVGVPWTDLKFGRDGNSIRPHKLDQGLTEKRCPTTMMSAASPRAARVRTTDHLQAGDVSRRARHPERSEGSHRIANGVAVAPP
ncbi:MAG: PRC-barrel domain-containing protein [Alphaproteobacteria bacterium]|nr:PRC-barrel domain-containing protein [Alphaproteobacteria bacterium]